MHLCPAVRRRSSLGLHTFFSAADVAPWPTVLRPLCTPCCAAGRARRGPGIPGVQPHPHAPGAHQGAAAHLGAAAGPHGHLLQGESFILMGGTGFWVVACVLGESARGRIHSSCACASGRACMYVCDAIRLHGVPAVRHCSFPSMRRRGPCRGARLPLTAGILGCRERWRSSASGGAAGSRALHRSAGAAPPSGTPTLSLIMQCAAGVQKCSPWCNGPMRALLAPRCLPIYCTAPHTCVCHPPAPPPRPACCSPSKSGSACWTMHLSGSGRWMTCTLTRPRCW